MEWLDKEADCRRDGYRQIAGVDEAGRGPLAGPVCAGAVILPPGLDLEGVNDSKKLTEKRREALYDQIIQAAVAWAVAFAEPEEIDRINIRQATHLAMQRAVDALTVPAEFLLVDGNDGLPFSCPAEYIVKGDARVQSIAAASILAKVTRDRYMKEMDARFPGYGFAQHKGYGTSLHMEAIRAQGLCPIHRRSFITPKVLGQV